MFASATQGGHNNVLYTQSPHERHYFQREDPQLSQRKHAMLLVIFIHHTTVAKEEN